MISIVALAGGVFPATPAQPAVAREEVALLTPADAPEGGRGFGRAVAISGSYIVVGAPEDDDPPMWQSGAAYVFKRLGPYWVQQIKLRASDRLTYTRFGESVAIDGDLLVIGGPYNAIDASYFGQAYVFRREGSLWVEEAILVPSGSAKRDFFGLSVSISGERVVVGAPLEASATGRTYVFKREGTSWVEEAVLAASDPAVEDLFGISVAIDGDLVVVGAEWDDDAGDRSGAAYIFRREGLTWAQEAKLAASDAASGHWFGTAVSVSGDTVIVGATGANVVGTAYVFRPSGGEWVEDAKLNSSDAAGGDDFGSSVDIDAEVILVAAQEDDDAGSASGSAYLFTHDSDGWVQEDKLVASNGSSHDLLGFSASLSGDSAVVGNIGFAAYVYAVPRDIPAASEWGMLVMALLVLTAGAILIRRGHSGQLEPRTG